ncbi:MAG: bis(5'-nucleosyl)-tetraphosphatase (symmetrical) YqeK [Negativicutes bacterium]|nr:bis(5'-nucleosyl)-tetraphosphatase (symmetrical) YqeK [Negativicutes bacterium]
MTEKSLDKLTATLSSKRWEHSLGVAATAAELAEIYGADRGKARLAGLIHDCAREMSNNTLLQTAEAFGIVVTDVDKWQPVLLHASVGAVIAQREYGVDDPEVLHAILWHTTGGPEMSLLDNILFLADFIEPGRSFAGVDKLRKLAKKNLRDALLAAYDQTLNYLIIKQRPIHFATVAGRNALMFHPDQ